MINKLRELLDLHQRCSGFLAGPEKEAVSELVAERFKVGPHGPQGRSLQLVLVECDSHRSNLSNTCTIIDLQWSMWRRGDALVLHSGREPPERYGTPSM